MSEKTIQHLKKFGLFIYPYIIIFIAVILMLLPQIMSKAYLSGIDSWFHMNQYYDTAMQIKTGHFQYFLSFFGFHGVGRIINAIYGAGFMYLNGLLLLLTKTWYNFEIIQDLLFLMFTGSAFYVLCHKNKINPAISIILSILYMLTMPIVSFLTDQEYIGIGASVFVLVMIQATQMARKHYIHPIALAVTMALTIQIHTLTTLAGTIFLIPFFLYAWYNASNKVKLWRNLGLSVLLTIALSANIWGAMFNVLPQRMLPPVPQGYPTVDGSLAFIKPFDIKVLGINSTSLLIGLLILGLIGLLVWNMSNGIFKIVYLWGVFTAWFASIYFPWHWLLHVYPAYLYQIQLPKRFVGIMFACLLLSAGMFISHHDVKLLDTHDKSMNAIIISMCSLILAIPMCLMFNDEQNNIKQGIKYYKSSQVVDFNAFHQYKLSKAKQNALRVSYHKSSPVRSINLLQQDTPDYLPTHAVVHTYSEYRHDAPYSAIEQELYLNDKNFKHVHRSINHGALTLSWNQKQSKQMTLPVIKYKNTQIALDGQLLQHPRTSRIGAIDNQYVPSGHTTLTLKYNTPFWMNILIPFTIMSWLLLAILQIVLWYIKIHERAVAINSKHLTVGQMVLDQL